MSKKRSDILLHPIRLRIVLAISGDELTTAELGERLPDVAPATLYRQVALLLDNGLLEVVDERRIRGGVERTYRLVSSAASLGSDDAAAMSAEEHLTGFVTFVGALVDAFGRYLEEPASNPADDDVGYHQAALWLDDHELELLSEELAAVVEPHLANNATPGRKRRLLSTILMPDVSALSS